MLWLLPFSIIVLFDPFPFEPRKKHLITFHWIHGWWKKGFPYNRDPYNPQHNWVGNLILPKTNLTNQGSIEPWLVLAHCWESYTFETAAFCWGKICLGKSWISEGGEVSKFMNFPKESIRKYVKQYIDMCNNRIFHDEIDIYIYIDIDSVVDKHETILLFMMYHM